MILIIGQIDTTGVDINSFFWTPFLQSLTASFITASFFSILIFAFLKPKIKISNKIAYFEEGGRTWYQFKFINKSLFKAYDLSLELISVEEVDATSNAEGVNTIAEDIELTNNSWYHIPRKKIVHRNTRYAPHCVTVRVKDADIKQILNSKKYLELRILLKHGFSNLSDIKRKRFKSELALVKGKFEFGNKFNIL